MTQKAKLALSLLEKELELISKEEQERTKAGMGVVTSGTGTAEDPFVVTATYYHYGLDSNQSGALNATMASYAKFNSSGGVMDSAGKYYIFEFTAVAVENEQEAATQVANSGRVKNGITQNWGNVIRGISSAGVSAGKLGVNSGNAIGLYTTNIDSLRARTSNHSYEIGDLYHEVFAHEIGHNLGLEHIEENGLMNENISFSENLTTDTQSGTFYGVNMGDLEKLVNGIQVNGNTGSGNTGIVR